MNEDMKYEKRAIQLAVDAGAALLRFYNTGNNQVNFKEDDSPVTQADIASHNIIVAGLRQTGLPVLSEEGAHLPFRERQNWHTYWLVDPLDGTREFIGGNPDFTVNIALISRRKPVLGVIYIPPLDTLYVGSPEYGCWKMESAAGQNDYSLGTLQKKGRKLPLEEGRPEGKLRIVTTKSHMTGETKSYLNKLLDAFPDSELISRGSSIKFCTLAEGRAEMYPRISNIMEWDTAAGQAILESSGGRVLTLPGKNPMRYNKDNLHNPYFIAYRKGMPDVAP